MAVLGFKNLSDRSDTAWVSTALSEMLTTELGAGEQLRTIPGETVALAKTDLALTDLDRLAPDSLERMRRILNADYFVLGSYLDLGEGAGGRIRLDLRMQDAVSGESLVAASEVSSEQQLLDMVSRSGRQLREKLGVADLRALQSTGIRATAASNANAMRSYAEGLNRLRTFEVLAAKDALLRAINGDPSYPLSHAALAQAWARLGYDLNAEAEAKKAMDLGTMLSQEDRAIVEGNYYEASQDWEKAIQTYRTLYASFPDNLEYGLDLLNAQIGGERANDAFAFCAKLRDSSAEATNDPRVDLAEEQASSLLSDNRRVITAGDAAIRKSQASGSRLLTARASFFQCRAYANMGLAKEAENACDQARRIYGDSGDMAGEAQALHAAAEVPLNQGDLSKAAAWYEQALSLARKTGDKRAIARELGNLALIAAQQGDTASAEKMFSETLRDFYDVGDKHGISVIEGNMGELFQLEGRLNRAVAEYRDALLLAREVGHKSSEAIDLKLIGDVLMEQGDLNTAMLMFEQAAAIQQQIGDKGYYANTLSSIGELHRQRDDLDGAKRFYDEALSLRRNRGEKGGMAKVDLFLAEMASDSNQGAIAERYAQDAFQEFQIEKESDAQILALALLSRSLVQQGKIVEALQAVAKANSLSTKSSDLATRLVFEIDSAYVLAAAKDFPKAEHLVRSALAESTELGFVHTRLEASLALGKIETMARNSAAGRVLLQQLTRDARTKGFLLISRKASAVR